MDANQLAAQWALDKWKIDSVARYDSSMWMNDNPRFVDTFRTLEARRHVAQCNSITISPTYHSWECGCYSEYTRDDEWFYHADIKCDHHEFRDQYIKAYQYDGGLPAAIQTMIDLDESDCYYDSEEFLDSES